jgi:lipid-binding SYLF domain-containing protein
MDRRTLLFGLPAALAACTTNPVTDPQQDLVDRARASTESLRFEANLGPELDRLIPQARGVIIVPSFFRAAIIVGGQGGSGVLMARGGAGWVGPVFLNLGSGSVGLQAGVQQAEVLLLVMNDGTLGRLTSTTVRAGADLSIAIGTAGAGLSGGVTPNLSGDIIAYARTAGLFGGIALEGMVISPNEDWNATYHGAGMTAREITGRGALAPGAARLARQLDPKV